MPLSVTSLTTLAYLFNQPGVIPVSGCDITVLARVLLPDVHRDQQRSLTVQESRRMVNALAALPLLFTFFIYTSQLNQIV